MKKSQSSAPWIKRRNIVIIHFIFKNHARIESTNILRTQYVGSKTIPILNLFNLPGHALGIGTESWIYFIVSFFNVVKIIIHFT